MSRELSDALVSLLQERMTSVMDRVNVLIATYTEKDLQDAVLVKSYNGWLPIHVACIEKAPLEVIQLLLDSDTDKKSILEKGDYAGLAIHFACEANAPVEVLQLLLDSDADKKSILEKDYNGRLPLRLACEANAPVEVLQLLMESDAEKNSILEKDNNGRLPIHWACEAHASVEVIQLFLDSDTEKKTILEKDKHGRLPIDIACKYNAPVEVVQLLLQVSICDRIEQLALQQWKIAVEELINAMTADDSSREKRKKVQEIYQRLSNYEEMEHTISLLALAIWRTSCLHWGDNTFKSMQEMEDLRATDDSFDPAEYKKERRIKSGADVIIRGVLPFLPVDDETPTPNV